MMYFSEDFVEEVRSKNDIVDVVSSYVRMQKKGSNFVGLCPFHSEKTGSFSVSPHKQIYYCFGCHKGGNVIKFMMDYENYSFPEAVKNLALRAGMSLPEESGEEYSGKSDIKVKLQEINKLAATYFYHQLGAKQGERAKQYFLDRGLTERTITGFGLGYSNKISDDLYKYLKSKGYDDDILKESGLVSIEERGARDKFFNRVMFPILDNNNRVIAFGGRVLGEGQPKYLNSPETKLFDKSKSLYALNFARLSKKDFFILCEGYMDVIALHQAGFTNAVAALGTALTVSHALLLKRYAAKLVLCFDSDSAGVNATKRALPILRDAGISVKILNLSPYKDPDEFIKALGNDEFEKRLENARNSFLWEIEILQKSYDLNDPEMQTNFHTETAKKLCEFPRGLERDNYVHAVSREFMIKYEDLKNLVDSLERGVNVKKEIQENKNKKFIKKEDKLSTGKALLLTWLVEDNSLIEKVRSYISPEDLGEALYTEILQKIYEEYDNGSLSPSKIINFYIDDENKAETVAKLFNTNLNNDITSDDKKIALTETIVKIKQAALDEKSRQVTDANELMRILKEKQELNNLKISLD